MTDADRVAAEALSLPLPPKYYLEYSDEAVAAGTAPRPPAPRSQYSCFGAHRDLTQSVIKPLNDYGVDVLYDPAGDRLAELRRLNQATIAEFISLVKDISQVGASDPSAKLERLELLFTNMHHLLNEFRPHQGHETLRAMMENQLEERTKMTKLLRETYSAAKQQLSSLATSTVAASTGPPGGAAPS